jgi:hypothetical protein
MAPPPLDDLSRLAPDQVTREVLDQLITEETLEGFTLEYKRELGNGHKVLEAVTSMANTWGGFILVGVDEKRDAGTGFGAPGPQGIVGVEPKDRARLANMCSTRLVPPFDPLIHAVDVGEGRVVLVVRIYSELAPRPVTYENRVLVRTDAGNRSADLFRLRSLFNETQTGTGSGLLTLGNATPFNHVAFILEDPPADLVVRAIAAIPILPTRRSRPKLTDELRAGVRDWMLRANINEWLTSILLTSLIGGNTHNPWLAHGHSTSSRAEFRWEGFPVQGHPEFIYPEARLVLELQPSQPGAPTRLDLTLEVIIRSTGLRNHFDPNGPKSIGRLGLQQLFQLFESVLSTFAEALRPAVVEHIGAATGTMAGPHVGLLNNAGSISEAIDTFQLQTVRGNEPRAGTQLLLDPELNLSDPDDRHLQAVEWFRELLLDLGFQGVDRAISQIVG